jgi:hypothetical protein
MSSTSRSRRDIVFLLSLYAVDLSGIEDESRRPIANWLRPSKPPTWPEVSNSVILGLSQLHWYVGLRLPRKLDKRQRSIEITLGLPVVSERSANW